jgi:hypothetical protein
MAACSICIGGIFGLTTVNQLLKAALVANGLITVMKLVAAIMNFLY